MVSIVTGPVVGGVVGLVQLGEITGDSLRRRATYDLKLSPAAVPAPTPAPRLDTAQVAISFAKAVMEGGDVDRWVLDESVVQEGIDVMGDRGAYLGPWTYDVVGDCSTSHIVDSCDVTVGRPGLANEDSDHATLYRIYVQFAEPPPGVDPADLLDNPELTVPLEEPKVVAVEGIAG